MKIKPRTRAGSWETFCQRYNPVPSTNGIDIWQLDEFPEDTHYRYVWTVVDCDGRWYVVNGYHWVNRVGYVLASVEWPDIEDSNPGYKY